MNWQHELQMALRVARLVGKHLAEAQKQFELIPDAPVDISTAVDKSAQDLILTELSAEFPTDQFVAEEKTAVLQSLTLRSTRAWIIDPIDGTRGFVTKNGQYSSMIALMEAQEIVVGVVVEPEINRLTYACKGNGCFFTTMTGDAPKRCMVSNLKQATDFTLVRSHLKPGKADVVATKLGTSKVIETYSAGIKLALVAQGIGDCYISDYPRMSDWDICAGHILVTEAGGTVTNLAGLPLDYRTSDNAITGGILASNGHCHAELLHKLQGFFDKP